MEVASDRDDYWPRVDKVRIRVSRVQGRQYSSSDIEF